MGIVLLVVAVIFLGGCSENDGTEVVYVDREVIEYLDNNNTTIEYVEVEKRHVVYVDVIEYVDRNITIVEYVDRNVTIIEYVDRNITTIEYVDRIVYVDRNITVIEYVDRNITILEYVYLEPEYCLPTDFNSTFVGRIIYEDSSPYKRGAVKAQGDTWQSYAITDDNGTFELGVKGESRFFFSAYSPYGDYEFYEYVNPLIVPEYNSGAAYDCTYDLDILTCLENEPIQ